MLLRAQETSPGTDELVFPCSQSTTVMGMGSMAEKECFRTVSQVPVFIEVMEK